jgi:hypothetical protein
MKKTLLTLIVVIAGIAFMCGYANAISGPCSNCHTMHNSQDGAAMAAFDGALDMHNHISISTVLRYNGMTARRHFHGCCRR